MKEQKGLYIFMDDILKRFLVSLFIKIFAASGALGRLAFE
jgi:hypothetical protein